MSSLGLLKPHTYQLSAGIVMRGQPDNVALSCGIYGQVLTASSPLSHVFPWVVRSASVQARGDVWEHLCFSVVSPIFLGTSFTLDWHCSGRVLKMECCCRGAGELAGAVLVAAD